MGRVADSGKALSCAWLLICSSYLLFGLNAYGLRGQYSYVFFFQPNTHTSPLSGLQIALDVLWLIVSLGTAALYANIVVKVICRDVLIRLENGLTMMLKKVKIFWAITVPIYWILAFIGTMCIPYWLGITKLVSGFGVLAFTFAFPFLLCIGYRIKRDYILPEETWRPEVGEATLHDKGLHQWMRSYLKRPVFNTFNFALLLAGAAIFALDVWFSVKLFIGLVNGKSRNYLQYEYAVWETS